MSESMLEQAIEAAEADFGDIADPVQREVMPIEEHLEQQRASGASSPRKLPLVGRGRPMSSTCCRGSWLTTCVDGWTSRFPRLVAKGPTKPPWRAAR